MDLDMQSMAAAIGVSVPVLRFLLYFAAMILVSLFHRVVPGAIPNHISAASGAILSYLTIGLSSNLHFLVPMFLGCAAMVISRAHWPIIITFVVGFRFEVKEDRRWLIQLRWCSRIGTRLTSTISWRSTCTTTSSLPFQELVKECLKKGVELVQAIDNGVFNLPSPEEVQGPLVKLPPPTIKLPREKHVHAEGPA